MAIYSATATSVSLSAATAKTVMELATPSTDRARLIQWSVEFNGTAPTAVPVLVELARASAAITGTAVTEAKWDTSEGANAVSALHTASAEGTMTDVLEAHFVHPQSGIVMQYPLGREPIMAVSSYLRIRCTAPASVSATVTMIWEE